MGKWSKSIIVFLLCVSLVACSRAAQQPDQDSKQPEEKEAIRLELMQDTYPVSAEQLDFEIINETGETYSVVLIPTLEQQQEDGSWQVLQCAAGFCGVGDSLAESLQSSIDTAWYPDLQAGVYRLSYTIQLHDEQQKTVSAMFTITE